MVTSVFSREVEARILDYNEISLVYNFTFGSFKTMRKYFCGEYLRTQYEV